MKQINLRIRALSPIVLIHGNNSDGNFFVLHHFTDFLEAFVWDNSIFMATDTVADHGLALAQLIPDIAKRYGVDSVHLVAHSKGGLDAREYLATAYAKENTLRVLSLTTLSTPHNGSVLADVIENYQAMFWRARRVKFSGFVPGTAVGTQFQTALESLLGSDDGRPDLRTMSCANFNNDNIPRLPRDVYYFAIGIDADRNDSGGIDPGEFPGLIQEDLNLAHLYLNAPGAAARVVNTLYGNLRSVRTVGITVQRTWRGKIATISAAPTDLPLGNDCLVTIPSALGQKSFESVTRDREAFGGDLGCDHGCVANQIRLDKVLAWIALTERAIGDLR